MVNKSIKIIAYFDTYAAAYYSACLISPWTERSAKAECIEGHVNISQASIHMPRHTTQPAWIPRGLSGPPWRSVSKATSTFRRLRYTALLSLLGYPVDWVVRPSGVYRRPNHNNLRSYRFSLSRSIYGGIHVYSQMCERNVLRWEYKKFNKKNSRTWNWKWS